MSRENFKTEKKSYFVENKTLQNSFNTIHYNKEPFFKI